MNIKKKILFLFIAFLMSHFLPNYAVAVTSFSALDTQGRLLNFASPTKVSGTGAVTSALKGDVYKYTNVITVNGVQVNAIVTITNMVNIKKLVFDNPTANPEGSSRANGSSYTTSFGGVVPQEAIFAPQITANNNTSISYAEFNIAFVDTTGKPLVLKNVYNNTLDDENVEFNEYGGFSSYEFAGDNPTNTTQRMVATNGLNGKIRFSNTYCKGDNGLYIKDQSRVQAKFDTISTLQITMGLLANGTVPQNPSCQGTSLRYYGAIFVQDGFTDSGTSIKTVAPTVNLLTTTNTKPSVTGTIGGTVSVDSPKGSALVAGDTFSVLLNGVTYTAPNANLEITGVNWKLNVPTALTAGQTYEVVATRNGVLVDQTNNELVITPVCVSPQVLNATSTACITPTATDTLWCHSGDGISYSKSVLASGDYSHVTHEFDEEAVGGKCPDDVITCTPPQILNAAGTACVTPVTSGTACTPITNPLTNIPADSDYDGKKVTICHFPPGNPTNVELNTIDLSALSTHIAHHGDVIWQSGKACPATTTSCDTPPTVNSPTTTDKIAASFNGNVGTSTTLTITIAGTSVSNATISPVTKNGTWTYTAPVISAGTYAVTVTGDGGTTTGTLTVTASVNPSIENKETTDKVAVLLTGTLGSSSSLQIQIKNSAGAIQDSGTATIIGSTWTFMPKVLPAGTYSIVAIGDAAHGNLSGSGTLTVTSSVLPTVDKKMTTEKVAVPLTGSVGSSTALTITVKDSTGITKATGTATITGTTWAYTPIVLPAGTYEVVATGDEAHGSLVDDSKNELVVTAIAPPTVESQTTFDTTPVIKGTVGAEALGTGEAFAVSVNGKTYTNGVDTNLKVTGTNWELTILVEIPGSATAYPVVATRGSAPDTKTGSGTLTITPCVLPKVVNAAKTACIAPIPTVIKQTINSNTAVAPVITGTVGEVALGSTETFSVTIKTTTPPQIYIHTTPETDLKVSGTNWTLTVPSNKTISAGTYDVEAARNTTNKNAAPHGELVINLVCLGTETAINGACVAKTFLPTVNSDSTPDTTPTITGTVGTSMLATNETFVVKVDGKSFTPTISNTDTTWSIAIPVANALSQGAHSVEAIRGDLTGTGTITITSCDSPKIVSTTTGDCSEPSLVPTVTPSASHNIKEPSIVVAGTWGDIELTAQELSSKAFSVKVHNSEHSDVKGVLVISGINWTFTLSKHYAGTFDVDAKRGSKTDLTDGELTIMGGSCCINGTTTQCPTTISVPDYTGECKVPVCPATNAAGDCTSPLPDKDKEETLPSQPTSKVEEAIKPPADLGYCDDGGKRSYGESMSGITIKRARIANAETIGGTFESNALTGMNVMYGTLTAGSYDDNDNSCQQGYCVNKTITGATLTGAFVDIANDYVNAAGNVIDGSNRGIALTGGVTNPTSFKKDGVTVINATITNGMITAGSDAAGNPVRGSITSGQFADAITHNTSALTKGRRTQGTLTNATITGATITTVNGVSVVGCDRSLDSMHTPCTVGVITSGTMDSTGVKTFGTVENATLTGATILNSNQCFSSGTVGSKGQLNWKEVVK